MAASNDFCTSGISHSGDIWVYYIDSDKIVHTDTTHEGRITADCNISGIFPLKLYLHHMGFQNYSLTLKSILNELLLKYVVLMLQSCVYITRIFERHQPNFIYNC